MNWQQEQQAFWELITTPQDLRDCTDAVDTLMAPPRTLSTVEALGIYNNAYHQRLIQISSELYPVLYHTLGKDVYTRLWLEYIAEHPPRPGPMGTLGEQLLTFARQHQQFGKLPALLDIIELEGLLISLFDKVDEPAYSLAMLHVLPAENWPQARWQPKQDWALLHSRFDLEKYWADMQLHLAKEDATAGDTGPTLQVAAEALHLLVKRVNHRMQFQRVNPAMALFLHGIQQNRDFSTLCELLADSFPAQDIPALSLQLLLKTIELELLTLQ